MKFNDLFIDSNLPKILKKEEIYDYFEKMKNGDKIAREKIINHNIRLVINEVLKKFPNSPYDLKELISIGLIGLIKSVDTFDTTKELQFSSYSTKCIDNEILMFMRKEKKYINDISLEQPIGTDEEKKELKIEDTLCDGNSDFVAELVSKYEDIESYKAIRTVINELPERARNIIIKYFGFENDIPMTQKAIAKELQLSQSYVSRIIKCAVKDISIQLKALGIIEKTYKQKEKSMEEAKQMPRKLQTIYEYFNNYTREQVDEMLSKLPEKEKELITLRYGNDLDNPITSEEWDKEKKTQYYGSLLPKMTKLLANPNYVFTSRKIKNNTKINTLQETSSIKEEQSKIISQNQSDFNNNIENISKSITKENDEKSALVKEDYIRIIELLKTSNFGQMLNFLTPKEAIIVCLRLGYVDDKYFSSNSIAEFLGIELDEVIESTQKALLLYKNSINEFIDKAVASTLESQNSNNLIRKKNN